MRNDGGLRSAQLAHDALRPPTGERAVPVFGSAASLAGGPVVGGPALGAR